MRAEKISYRMASISATVIYSASRMILRTGRMQAGETDNSSTPIFRNVSVRVVSAPNSPQIPHQIPSLCAFSVAIWMKRSTAGWWAS